MTEPEPDDIPAPMLRSLQVVVCAMVVGVFAFAIVLAVVRSQRGKQAIDNGLLLSYQASGAAALVLILRPVVLRVMTATGRKRLAAQRPVTAAQLMQLMTNRTIVGAALLEGAAFYLLVAYLVEGHPWALGEGLAVGGLLAALQFPTRARAETALAADREAIEGEQAAV